MSRNSIASGSTSYEPIPDSFVTSSLTQLYVSYAAYMDFSTGTVRAWTGLNNINLNDDFGGGTYTALGQFGSIGNAQETFDVSAKTYELSLSGVPSNMIYLALVDNYRGRSVAVYMLLHTDDFSNYQQICVFRGWMDQMTISEVGTTSNIKISCESRLIQLENPIIQWYTDQWQQLNYPGDHGLQFLTSMMGQDIVWGTQTPSQGSIIISAANGGGLVPGATSGNRMPS